MVVCKFWLQGNCRFGESCRFEHPGAKTTTTSSNRFGVFGAPSGGGTAVAPATSSNQPANNPYNISETAIVKDLTEDRPIWIFSCYAPGRNAPGQLFGGPQTEQSFEELRLHHYKAVAANNAQAAIADVEALSRQTQQQIENAVKNPGEAVRYIMQAEQQHPNRHDICKANTQPGTGEFEEARRPKHGALSEGQSSAGGAFGQPSQSTNPFGVGFGAKPTFGQNAGSAFGQPSQLGGASAFGQPSKLGTGTSPFGASPATSAFGQPSQPGTTATTSAFGQPAAPAFGQPSLPGTAATTSAFGQPSKLGGGTSAFGQPSQLGGGGSAFGQPSALGQKPNPFGASGFGQQQPQQQAASGGGFSKFAQTGTGTGGSAFGQPSQLGQTGGGFGGGAATGSAFGQPAQSGGSAAFGQPSGLGPKSSPFAAATGGSTTASPFSNLGSTSQAAGNSTAATSPFGQSASTTPSNPFGANASTTSTAPVTTNAFGQPSQLQAAASNPFAAAINAQSPGGGTAAAAPTTSPFGQPSGATASAPSALNPFQKAAQQQSSSPFGQPASTGGTGVFGRTDSVSAAPAQISAGGDPGGPNATKQHPPLDSYAQRDPVSGRLLRFKGKPVAYQTKDDVETPVVQRPDGKPAKIWFPNGPPPYNEDTELKPETYTPEVQAQYAAFMQTGRFEVGKMPEVPPKREWCLWNF